MQFLCTMNTSRFRVRPSINQPLLSLPVSLSSTRRSVIHKVQGHERNSRIFSEGHPYFLHLPEMHWIRNGRSNETETGGEEGEGEGKGEGRKKSPREVRAKITSVPCRGAQWILRIRRTSFILALLDVHISRSRSRRIDPSTPCRLCPLRNPTRASTGEPPIEERLPASRAARTKDHTQANGLGRDISSRFYGLGVNA